MLIPLSPVIETLSLIIISFVISDDKINKDIGITINLINDKNIYFSDEELLINIEINNISKAEIGIDKRTSGYDIGWFEILNKKGESINYCGLQGRFIITKKEDIILLKPGDAYKKALTLDLKKYKINYPGRYKLIFYYHCDIDAIKGWIKSNEKTGNKIDISIDKVFKGITTPQEVARIAQAEGVLVE